MADVKNAELVSRLVGRWHPGDLAFVESVHYDAPFESHRSDVILTGIFQRRDLATGGWPSRNGANFRVVIRCEGVRTVKMHFTGTPVQIMGFDIIDVSANGLEGIAFEVEDYEDGRISLACSDISIVRAEEL